MKHIELARPVEAYFAYAELPVTGRGRHFTITFTYMENGRPERMQWWWHVSKAQERAGESLVQGLRQEAVQRFRQHIEQWLLNSSRRLTGGDPFPVLEAAAVPAVEVRQDTPVAADGENSKVTDLRKVARLAVGR